MHDAWVILQVPESVVESSIKYWEVSLSTKDQTMLSTLAFLDCLVILPCDSSSEGISRVTGSLRDVKKTPVENWS
jgi:hypothetical protein